MKFLSIIIIACIADSALSFSSSVASRQLDALWNSGSTGECQFSTETCSADEKYSSFNGSCHNVVNSRMGQAGTPLKRLLSAAYDDGVNTPRSKSILGSDLPNPRTISNSLSPDNQAEEPIWTHIFTTFGQFLTHDIAETAFSSEDGSHPECPCDSNDSNSTSCHSFTVPTSRKDDLSGTCMEFIRSSGSFPDLSNCEKTHREQVNVINSFIDASTVYGNTEEAARELRTFKGGLLITSSDGLNYLPEAEETCSEAKCFKSGDLRTSENLGLTGIHTVFLREHNRIASELAASHPQWLDERLYQETRRIMIAILQHIVYDQYIPGVIGRDGSEKYGIVPTSDNTYFTGHNTSVNPQLYNEFNTAALRYGHSIVSNSYRRYNTNNEEILDSELSFSDINFKSEEAYNSAKGGIDSIVMGLINTHSGKYDSNIAEDLRNNLIDEPAGSAFDLAAFNINRGRDHGLQPYVKYLEACTGHVVDTWEKMIELGDAGLYNTKSITKAMNVYEDVRDIDLWIGGLIENKEGKPDVITGPTFTCIIGQQFKDLKEGDRFYYENAPNSAIGTAESAFTLEQLAEIKKVKFSTVLCNSLGLESIQQDVFFVTDPGNVRRNNEKKACSSYEQMDLSIF